MKRILVAVDFSDATRVALREASRLAKQFQARLWLLHVAPPDPDFVGYDAGPQSVRDLVAETFRKEHRKLQGMARRLSSQGINVVPLLVQGPTVRTIDAEARKLKIQCVIMGSHGHGAMYRALLGSVCEGVLRKISCPILIIPAKGKAK